MAAQTRRPDEIWLIDDASPEPATRAYLQSLGKTYQGIPLHIVYQKTNQGAGAARNRALAKTLCELVAFLDADDVWLPQHLATAEAALAKSGAIFIASNFISVSPNGTEQICDCAAIAARTDFINGGNPRIHYFYRGFIGILTVVARREALVRAGGFNAAKRYSLDWELWHAALAATPNSTFMIRAEVTARYTLSPNGLTSQSWLRLAERENYLPLFVRNVAKQGHVGWPLLLLRGWLTVQYETIVPLLHKKDWRKIMIMLVRTPVVLVKLYAQAMRPQTPRPNFLAPPWLEEK